MSEVWWHLLKGAIKERMILDAPLVYQNDRRKKGILRSTYWRAQDNRKEK